MHSQIKKGISAVVIVLTLFSFLNIARAQESVTNPTGNTGSGVTNPTTKTSVFTLQNPLNVNSIGELLQSFLTIFAYLAVIFAVLMIIYKGFQYVWYASQGNESQITKLHGELLWIVVGTALIIGATLLINIVIGTLSATKAINPNVINSANKAIKGN